MPKRIETLAELRILRGVTQEALAPHLGVKQAALSKLERKTNPSFATLRAFVEALGGELRVTARFPGDVVEFVGGPFEPPASR
jgi:transcriptional regulator with XRE-family HTH domain